MKVFMTGATGYIGSRVARRLRDAGHDVTALVRPTSDHAELSKIGVATVSGDMTELGRMREAVQAHDVIIHAAIASAAAGERDGDAIRELLAARSSEAQFLFTSGVWLLARHDGPVDEDSLPDPLPIVAWRVEHERVVLDASTEGAPTAVIRPGCVYGGRQSLFRDWFSSALREDPIRVIGEGKNRWATIHVDDLADLYLQVVDRRASGIFHATDDNEDSIGEMATALSKTSGGRSRVLPMKEAEARATMGPVTDAYLANQRVSSRRSRELLGWQPAHHSFASTVSEQLREWHHEVDLAGEPDLAREA